MHYTTKSIIAKICFFTFTFLLILSVPIESIYADSKSKKVTNTTIMFLDGSEQKIEGPVFIYEFVYENDTQYYNPPHHNKKIFGIAYNESGARDASKDNFIEIERIVKIELKWDTSKTYFFRPQEISIFLNDGNKIEISGKSLDAMSSKFLCGKPKASTIHGRVMIRGIKDNNGKKERLSALLAYSPNYDKSITVKQLFFRNRIHTEQGFYSGAQTAAPAEKRRSKYPKNLEENMLKVKTHPDYPQEEGRYIRGNDASPVAVAIVLCSDADKIPPEIESLVRAGVESGAALSGTVQTENIGFEKIICKWTGVKP